MSRHAYPRSAAVADLLRAAAGSVFALVPLAAANPPPAVTVVLLVMLGIFVALGLRGAVLLFTHIEVSAAGVSAGGARELPWRDLRRVKLTYYSTRRDGRSGWLQLTLESAGESAGRARLRIDSRLDGFRQVALAAAQAANANRLPLDPPTRSNFAALGIAVDDPSPAG